MRSELLPLHSQANGEEQQRILEGFLPDTRKVALTANKKLNRGFAELDHR